MSKPTDPPSRPMRLASRLRRPDTGLDATALATALLIALMLATLAGSRFIFAPGLTVGVSGTLSLPVAKSDKLPGAVTTDTITILALKQDDMAIWNGRIRTLARLAEDFAAEAPAPGTARGTLLIKADKSVSMQTFFEVVAMARKAGFTAVHIAGEDGQPR